MNTCVHLWQYLSEFILEWEILGNLADKSCRENHNTHFLFNNFSENHAVYDIWKNMLEPRRLRVTI